MMQHKNLHPWSFWLPGSIAALLVFLCVAHNHGFVHDDTYITLRYARHLLGGFGPIWNKQGPRVEGFTSPLHLLLVAAVSATGAPMILAARIVSITSHLFLLLYLFSYLRRRIGLLGAELGVVLIATAWVFIIWDLGGLDAVLYAALATIGVLTSISGFPAEQKHRMRFFVSGSTVLGFATLARPEGGLLLGGAWVLILLAPAMKTPTRLQVLAAAIGVAALVLLPIAILRWTYFHTLVPNTMHAKLGGISHSSLIFQGLKYLVQFLVAPPYVGLFAAAAGIFSRGKGRIQARDVAIWGFIALSSMFVIFSGGDHMIAYRFCLVIYSLLATVLVLHLAQVGLLARPPFTYAICSLLLLGLALQISSKALNPIDADAAAETGKTVGIYIKDHWPAGSLIALNTAGSTPFYADDMRYIDMLGLNDSEIARRKDIPRKGPWTHLIGHLKGDGASVLARKPDSSFWDRLKEPLRRFGTRFTSLATMRSVSRQIFTRITGNVPIASQHPLS